MFLTDTMKVIYFYSSITFLNTGVTKAYKKVLQNYLQQYKS